MQLKGRVSPALPAGSGSGQLLELEVPPPESGRSKNEVSFDAPAALRMGGSISVASPAVCGCKEEQRCWLPVSWDHGQTRRCPSSSCLS